MSRWILISTAIAAALAVGCDGGGGGSSTSSVNTRATNGACPSTLQGAGDPGAACQTYNDCKEVCCNCRTGTKGFASAACIDGKCAAAVSACAKGEENSTTICSN